MDIRLDSGEEISAKSYATAEKTAKAQASIDSETGLPAYHGQKRLVPTDQLTDVQEASHRDALRNKSIRPELSVAYKEVEAEATDVVTNDEGISSRGVTREELDDIAREGQKQEFSADKHGVTTRSAVTTDYLVHQAIKAGYTAATITVVMQLVPEIFKAIDYLIKNGEIDLHHIQQVGMKGISSGVEGFLRGSVSATLCILCNTGALGEKLMNINPTLLGTGTALVMEVAKNAVLVAAGKMSSQQMGASFVDSVMISGGYLLGMHIPGLFTPAGIVGQVFGSGLPVVGLLLGSLLGTSFSVIYKIGKNKLISFCTDTGFTCFGLVKQDYVLPERLLNELGIETITVPRTQVERVNVPRTQATVAKIDTTEYETIEFTVLRRGVIGVNKIGYVC